MRILAAFAFLLLFANPAAASTSIFTNTGSVCTVAISCWQAGDFGLLVGLGSTAVPITGTVTVGANGEVITGEIGFGAGSKINAGTKTESWSGAIDFADPLSVTSGHCPAGNCLVPTGNTLTNVTLTSEPTFQSSQDVDKGIAEMQAMSVYWKNLAGQTAVTNLGHGTNTLGTVGAGIQVFSTASINTNALLTISGNANDLIIINVSGSVSITKGVTLSGLNPDQVLFNILGTAGTPFTLNGGAGGESIGGDFFVVGGPYSVSNATVSGRILGGKGNISWGTSFTLTSPADTSTLPEPGTWVMMLAGAGSLIYFHRRRRKA